MTSRDRPLWSPEIYRAEHDTLIASGIESGGERLEINKSAYVNGIETSRKKFSQLRGLARHKTLINIPVSSLGLRTGICRYCKTSFTRTTHRIQDPVENELPSFCAVTSFRDCPSCRHWEFVEWRTETHDGRGALVDMHAFIIAESKVRTFEAIAPEGSLEEIALWFRRHPNLYNSVTPTYLEKLVARIFAATGQFSEVTHVGRPDDGGVDVILVEADAKTWLVQVKRREHRNSVEPVSTIRNLLGTLVLESSSNGIVVSSADHFSYRAQAAASKAGEIGYVIRLMDRKALDALLATKLPDMPWREVISSMDAERKAWFGASENDAWLELPAYDTNQLTMFDL